MNIQKVKIDELKRCYCASSLYLQNEPHYVFASEDPNEGCIMASGKYFEKRETLWKEAGGCMSIIQIPNSEEFLAVQEFYLKQSPSLAKIVWGKRGKNGWEIQDVLALPYVHRFDIYHKNGVDYFICATIATSKENKDDWSVPGRIYVGVLGDLNEGIEVEILKDGLYHNHGYWHNEEEGCGYFGSDQGILKVTPPREIGGKWQTECILQGCIGEISSIDIDGDGIQEIMTIEPFHGSAIYIYKLIDGVYTRVYQYGEKIDFAHTLSSGIVNGKATFLAGVRRLHAELFYVQYSNGKYVTTIIEKGVGPANVALVHEANRDIIVSANHTMNEAALYVIDKER